MDISGVDVDFLNDEEILELCSDIADTESEEISVLKGIDVNNLSDDKVNELYYDVMYKKEVPESKVIKLTDRQVLDNNYNIVDEDENEIIVFNGKNIDINNLSDDEILSLYKDVLDNENVLIASDEGRLYSYGGCYVNYKYHEGKDYCYSDNQGNEFCEYTAAYKSFTVRCPTDDGYDIVFTVPYYNYGSVYFHRIGGYGYDYMGVYTFIREVNDWVQYCTAYFYESYYTNYYSPSLYGYTEYRTPGHYSSNCNLYCDNGDKTVVVYGKTGVCYSSIK